MKIQIISTGILATLLAVTSSSATVNAPVNIAYPIANSANNNLVQFAFSVTCPGGQNSVRWLFDGTVAVGNATFYDNFNTQFLHKLPAGSHTIDVFASCGQERMKFIVN